MPPPSLATSAPPPARTTSASALWVDPVPAAALAADPLQPRAHRPAARLAAQAPAMRWADAGAGPTVLPWPADERDRLLHALTELSRADGVLCCGLVDLERDALLVALGRQPAGAMGAAAAEIDLLPLTQALAAARRAHQAVVAVAGDEGLPDEVLITAGPRQALLRRLTGPAALGFVARLDRTQANLALLRFRLADLGSRSA